MRSSLIEKYKKITHGREFRPPVHNFSSFIQSVVVGPLFKKYLDKFYKNRARYDCLTAMGEGKAVLLMTETKSRANTKECLKNHLKDPRTSRFLVEKIKESIGKINKEYDKLTYGYLRNRNFQDRISDIDQAVNLVVETQALYFFAIYFDFDFCWQQLQRLKYPIKRERLEVIWEKASHPIEESFAKEQELFILNLLASGKKISEAVESCQYFYTSYYGAKDLSLTKKMLKKQYERFATPAMARTAIKKAQEDLIRRGKEYQIWRKKLSPKEKIIVDFIQTIIMVRDIRRNAVSKGFTIVWRLAEILCEEAGVSKELIPYCIYPEIRKGIGYLKKIKKELAARKNGFLTMVDYGKKLDQEKFKWPLSEKILYDYFLESEGLKKGEKTSELKGQIGSKGIVRGRVRIVLDLSAVKKFKTGEILVAGMTRAELVPLMGKAAAVVTDEGSITCHAAIVSRELGIPCIIATKVATKVLKDGMLVEVDADAGIVKIIY